MWQALRAELAYYRPYLWGGLGIGAGVALIVTLVFFAVGDQGPPHAAAAGIRAMFMIMAPMIVGFVIQGLRPEERRDRLLLAGPLTPRQIATASVLMTVTLLGIGIVAAGLTLVADSLLTGARSLESLQIAGYVGGLMFAILQMIPLAQEAAAARSQRRSRAAATGWAVFVAAVLLFAALSVGAFLIQGPMTWPSLHLANLAVALTAMVAATKLYAGRTDFTR